MNFARLSDSAITIWCKAKLQVTIHEQAANSTVPGIWLVGISMKNGDWKEGNLLFFCAVCNLTKYMKQVSYKYACIIKPLL